VIENACKHRLQQGHHTVGIWISFPSPSVVEVIAGMGPDWLMIDTEHGAADWERVEDLIRAMQGTSVTPLVRVDGNDPVLIKKALDRGALGVLVPLVSTAEAARAAVAASRYPPDGIRGVAGTRASRYGADLPQYFASWNREVLVACQIETMEALNNVDSIAAVPGLDVLFIVPNDLSAALNCFRQFDHPDFIRAVDRILAAARRHHLATGYMATSAEDVVARVKQGFRFVSLASDTRLLAGAFAAEYEKIRAGLAAPART
jgi:2-keto-3-deoxy-L-rhamnonate aldolase RhmA